MIVMSMNLYGIMRQSLAGEIYRMPVLLGIVGYVLMALGLYEMAKSRNLSKAWLACYRYYSSLLQLRRLVDDDDVRGYGSCFRRKI